MSHALLGPLEQALGARHPAVRGGHVAVDRDVEERKPARQLARPRPLAAARGRRRTRAPSSSIARRSRPEKWAAWLEAVEGLGALLEAASASSKQARAASQSAAASACRPSSQQLLRWWPRPPSPGDVPTAAGAAARRRWVIPRPHGRLAAPRGAGSPPARGARGSQHCSPRAGGARHPRGIHQSTARPRNQPSSPRAAGSPSQVCGDHSPTSRSRASRASRRKRSRRGARWAAPSAARRSPRCTSSALNEAPAVRAQDVAQRAPVAVALLDAALVAARAAAGAARASRTPTRRRP